MGHSEPVRAQLMSLSTVVTSKPRTVPASAVSASNPIRAPLCGSRTPGDAPEPTAKISIASRPNVPVARSDTAHGKKKAISRSNTMKMIATR